MIAPRQQNKTQKIFLIDFQLNYATGIGKPDYKQSKKICAKIVYYFITHTRLPQLHDSQPLSHYSRKVWIVKTLIFTFTEKPVK